MSSCLLKMIERTESEILAATLSYFALSRVTLF